MDLISDQLSSRADFPQMRFYAMLVKQPDYVECSGTKKHSMSCLSSSSIDLVAMIHRQNTPDWRFYIQARTETSHPNQSALAILLLKRRDLGSEFSIAIILTAASNR